MERGLIRPAVPEDAERLLEIYAYYVLNTAVTYEDTVPALPDFRSSMEKVLERYPFLVLCAEGRVQGYACARAFYEHAAFAHCCQLTIYLDPSSVRHGYGCSSMKHWKHRSGTWESQTCTPALVCRHRNRMCT